MLLKASAGVPHMGGQLTHAGRSLLRDSARLDAERRETRCGVAARGSTSNCCRRIRWFHGSAAGSRCASWRPTPTVGRAMSPSEAFIESGNTEVATASRIGLMTAVRRGEAPMLARYEGAYAATTLTVMGDRTGFAWAEPPTWERIDELSPTNGSG